MELRRAQFSGATQGGYSSTTGNLLTCGTLDQATAKMTRWQEENAREFGTRYGWSEARCGDQGIYASPEASLRSQGRALRGLQSDAIYFGLGATSGAHSLFQYLKTGELRLPEPRAGDPEAPRGSLASALHARLHRVGYGVATATRDRIFTRATPRDVPEERFRFFS
jgi:hypothetical protein